MNKRIISAVVSLAMAASAFTAMVPAASAAEAKAPKYQAKARQMEELNRGLVAAYRTANGTDVTNDEAGVYLSWRLLGDEPLETQEFDIYKNDTLLTTTTGAKGTNYIDTTGTMSDTYKVVKKGASSDEVQNEQAVAPQTNHVASGSGRSSLKQSFMYEDILIERPADSNGGHYYTVDKDNEGGANDASVGDLDGDGDYEIVLKWDPTNSKDAASGGTTGRTYIDAYEIDPTNTDASKNANGHLYKWRIDLGPHVRAGAHENPFLVYDFDGDGRSEIVSITGLGAVDGQGNYVTDAGDTEEIRNADNTQEFLRKGKNIGPEYYTIFDGETGAALCTTEAILIGREDGGDWGDSSMNRSSRYLAAVAYLDGVHPSLVMCRGYYDRAALRAYTWDGTDLTLVGDYDSGKTSGVNSLYGQGNHNLSVGDIDNDGCDEIVYGSASLDNDMRTVLGNTQLGHGDAMHMSDFNNDGMQEVFSVKEKSGGYSKYAEDLRNALTGEHFWESGKVVTSSDNGRGVMDNIDDAYAKAQYDSGNKNVMAIGWSSGLSNAHDFNGDDLKAKPASAGNGSFDNFLVYWDGDLGRELLDSNIIQKYDAANGWTTRFWGEGNGYTLTGGTTNNYTKRNPCLVADLWGDWREEIIMATGKGEADTPALRIFTSTLPTDYRLTTLMHDCQYRLAIAWQNVAYNQPPHTSYYVGSVALAADENGNTLNYLAPETAYTVVTYEAPAPVAVESISLTESEMMLEKGNSATLSAVITPTDATKKGITWTSSDTSVATVSNGVVKAVGDGTATITATSKDMTNGTLTAECTVTVYSTPVESISLSDKLIELGMGASKQLSAYVKPDNATDKSVKWTSADEAVATVTSDGTVTGVSYGKTVVTAMTTDGGFAAECIVKVKPIETVNSIGSDVFDFAQPNTDANISLAATAISAKITHNYSESGTVVQRSFESYTKNKATLVFNLTTGGESNVGTGSYKWDWAGHEYSLGLKFLDADGNNIMDIVQPYAGSPDGSSTGAGKMTYQIADGDKGVFESDWTKEIDGLGNIQGSAKTWLVTAVFNYDLDTCTITIGGGTAGTDGKYSKTFALGGASFKTLQLYTTKDGEGTIKASPRIENLSYTKATQVSGETDALYERGSDIAWSEADLTDWVQTNSDTAALALDSENGRIWYNPTNPGASYSAEKTIEGITQGALVTYDVDWYFGSAVNRDGNFEYIQFGDYLRLGWTNGYKMYISTDGGANWVDSDKDGTPDSIFDGTNQTYTKNVKVIFDTAKQTIKALYLDGTIIDAYTDYQYRATDEATVADVDSVQFGFTRTGAPPETWPVPNGIDRIRVSQFIEGEEIPDFTEIKIDGADKASADITYSILDEACGAVTIVGALYSDGELVEVSVKDIASPVIGKFVSDTLPFENDVNSCDLKVFLWNSLEGMEPICDAAYLKAGEGVKPSKPSEPETTTEPEATPDADATTKPETSPVTSPVTSPETSPETSPSTSPDTEETSKPEVTLTPTTEPTTAPTPTPEPTIDPNVVYAEVFLSSENFLMENSAANKWIRSSDSTETAYLSEITTDIGGNATAKMYLANKAVQYVLDDNDVINSGCFKLTYDVYIDKTTNSSGYGRYFRTYLDNAAHAYSASTGMASERGTDASFFHMMDYEDAVYTTSSVDLIAGTQNNDFTSGAVKLSNTGLEGSKWYRVVIEGDLDNDLVTVSYYSHGASYNENLDITSIEPHIQNKGCFTDGREKKIKQIKFMRTAGGDLYFDNIKLEKGTVPAE